MNSTPLRPRRVALPLARLIAVAAAASVLTFSATSASRAAGVRAHEHIASAPALTAKATRFHDRMRALWEEHGSWTRMVIVSFVGNLPNLAAAEQVLLNNQVKIGEAVKPYYGRAAGNQLTKLLKAHILGAVDVLVAAKSGDPNRLSTSEAAWYANGREIADFLHAANPRFLSRAAARQMMKVHLDQVIEQAVDELTGDYAGSARAFGPYIRHILRMADMISGGIIQQFPARFR
jgi:hypothetical protein